MSSSTDTQMPADCGPTGLPHGAAENPLMILRMDLGETILGISHLLKAAASSAVLHYDTVAGSPSRRGGVRPES